MSSRYLTLRLQTPRNPPADSRYVSLWLGPPPPSNTLLPDGLLATAIGTATVWNYLTYATPSGLDASQFGTAVVSIPQYVTAGGLDAFAWTPPTIARREQPAPLGWDSLSGLSGISIAPWNGRPTPTPWVSTQFGTAWPSLWIRTLDFTNRGINALSVPAPMVSDSPRTLVQRIVSTLQFGIPELGATRTRTMVGFEATDWGTSEAWDKHQTAGTLGVDSTEWGLPDAQNYTRYVRSPDFIFQADYVNVGQSTDIRNARQILVQVHITGPDDGGVFGNWMHIANANRQAPSAGFLATQHGSTTIALTARALAGANVGDATDHGSTLIAEAIRTLDAYGWDADGSTNWHSVRNSAAQAITAGWQQTAAGAPAIRNNLAYCATQTIGDTDGHAEPWVSRSPRDLAAPRPEGFWGTQWGEAATGIRVRYIDSPPAPDDTAVFGSTNVVEHFTRILPRMDFADSVMGDPPRVRNVTPQVYPIPDVIFAAGTPAIRTQWRTLEPAGLLATTWNTSRPFVEYRNKTVRVASLLPFAMRDQHRVELATPSPPVTQTLNPRQFGTALYDYTTVEFGAQSVRDNCLYPTGFTASTFGLGAAREPGIRPAGMQPPWFDQLGTPTVFGPQYIRNAGGQWHEQAGDPSLSPWWIWAPRGYPFGSDDGEVIDSYLWRPGQDKNPLWGDFAIELKNRSVAAHSVLFGWEVEIPDIQLRHRTLQARSFSAFKPGFPTFPSGQALALVGTDMLTANAPSVVNLGPYVRYLGATGLAQDASGRPEVSNWIRTISADALAATQMPNHRIAREFDPFEMVGFDALQWGEGDGFVDYAIRTRAVQSFDSDDFEYSEFRRRMRIAHDPPIVRGPRPGGMDAAQFGAPVAGIRVRPVQPWQFSTYAHGYPRVARVEIFGPFGDIDASEFGDPDRVVPGTIRPRPGELGDMGRVTTQFRFTAQVGDVLGVPAPSAGWLAIAAGWDSQEHGEAAALLAYGHNCGRTPRAMRPIEWTPTEHGSTSIA